VIEFLFAVKETVGNIRKRLSNVYGNAAVHRSNVGHWAKRGMEKQVKRSSLMFSISWKGDGHSVLGL